MNPQILLMAADVPAGRVFGLDQQTAIQIGIQLLNSGVLAAVLAFLLYNPVRNFMRKRTEKIAAQLDKASNDMAKANELKIQYDQKLRDIEQERDEILDAAHKLAAEKSRQVLAEARTEADSVRAKAAADIEMERERVKDEIKQAIIEVSSAMAAKFVADAIDRETQDKLFAETMAELEEIEWQN